MITLKRSQLNKKYGLSKNQWTRRHDDVMEYLSEFMNITQVVSDSGRFSYQVEGEMPQSIPPLPEKRVRQERTQRYKKYILTKQLTLDFKPNSKAKVARDAQRDFARREYGHESIPSIVRNYTAPIMDKYGEESKDHVWVRFDNYKPLTEDELNDLKYFFKAENMAEEEMACAWVKENQGQDVTKEKESFQRAVQRFIFLHGFRPVLASKWRLKQQRDSEDEMK